MNSLRFKIYDCDVPRLPLLRPIHAQILSMYGLPYIEIAELLGIKIGTVKSRLNRARAELMAVTRDEANTDNRIWDNTHRGDI